LVSLESRLGFGETLLRAAFCPVSSSRGFRNNTQPWAAPQAGAQELVITTAARDPST
jgi:hypothetical protein